jgi:hypothetical protein
MRVALRVALLAAMRAARSVVTRAASKVVQSVKWEAMLAVKKVVH